MSIDLFRGILAGLLFLIGLALWNDWQAAHPEAPPVVQTAAIPQAGIPVASNGDLQNPNSTAVPAQVQTAIKSTATPIVVDTDVLHVKIDPVGGALVGANLTQYPNSLQDKNAFELLNQQTDTFYTAQSGLSSPQGPDHTSAGVYQASQQNYTLPQNQTTVVVPMVWRNNGLEVTKTYTFTRGSYLIQVDFSVKNNSGQVWKGQFYSQLKRSNVTPKTHGLFQINPFVGAVVSSPDKRYQKFSFTDLSKEPVNQTIQNGWMAMEQHYFISAWIPDANQTYQYTSQSFDDDKLFAVNMVGPELIVAPGETKNIGAKLYVGPSIASTLGKIAPGLNLTVDYGFLWFIGVILFWLLEHIHQFIGNWGWSIVILTIFIKLCFYQLSATSYRSMAAMRKLQPQLQQIKERYGDDRQKVGQMTMELYKKEKVNPMGGCLPLLVQIPVFIALYWVLLESVQLRQAPFILWIHDLAIPDPYYILPLLMGATMFIQQRMSPPPPDPMQAKLMMAMPVVFTFFFLNFPAGLVLYWVVSNSVSILQQWWITKRYADKAAEIKAEKKKGSKKR